LNLSLGLDEGGEREKEGAVEIKEGGKTDGMARTKQL